MTTIRQCLKAAEPGTGEGAVWLSYQPDGDLIREIRADGESVVLGVDEWTEKLASGDTAQITCPDCGWVGRYQQLASAGGKCPWCGKREFLVVDVLTMIQAVKELLAKFQE